MNPHIFSQEAKKVLEHNLVMLDFIRNLEPGKPLPRSTLRQRMKARINGWRHRLGCLISPYDLDED